MTVREWFRLDRAVLWESQIGIAVEFDKLSNAIAEGDEATARAAIRAIRWLLLDEPYKYSHHHNAFQEITR